MRSQHEHTTSPAPDAEASTDRWKRRAVTIPVMLAVTSVGLLGFPLIVLGTTFHDVVRLRWRLPTLRVYLFLLQYAINDSVEIFLAPILWVAAGFGTRLDSAASLRRHERLQSWSLFVLARRARRLLGIRVETDAASLAALTPGPVIVMCRHVSVFDASLPSLLYRRLGYHVRGIVMSELLGDPGFDLLYGRLGSVFVPRDDGATARARITTLGCEIRGATAAVIFPEGRLFRREVLDRRLGRLATTDPPRAERLRQLRHVLPPRPAGVSALLDAAPGADVVVVAHAGLEEYDTFRSLARAVPLRRPITIGAWRVSAAEIPEDLARRTAWLDEQWCRVDAWIHVRTTDDDCRYST